MRFARLADHLAKSCGLPESGALLWCHGCGAGLAALTGALVVRLWVRTAGSVTSILDFAGRHARPPQPSMSAARSPFGPFGIAHLQSGNYSMASGLVPGCGKSK